MATQTTMGQLTLGELAKRRDPNGETAAIVESLTEDNEVLLDAIWLPANGDKFHKTTRRTTQPAGSWRKFNAGVSAESSKTQEVIESMGMLESYAENDKALIDMESDPDNARDLENIAFLEGLSQTLATAVFYSNVTTDPEKFDGFAPRMPTLSATTNVIGQGGTGSDLTSIYIVQWGPTKVHMIYPKNHKSYGVEHRDLGEHTKVSGTTMWQVYRDWFGMKPGLVVRDDRCIARLANIETTGNSNTFNENNLITLLNRMPKRGRGAKLYVNDTIQTQMEIRLKDKTNVHYTAGGGEGLAGEPMVKFRGCAIRGVDKIIITEAALT